MEKARERYIRDHSTPQDEALEWIERQTCTRTHFPQMLSGPVQGRFLKMLVELSQARNVLEIGTFTGYSSVWLAYGLPDGGHLDSLEINDELEHLIREGWERAGITDKATLHIGDALDTLSSFLAEGRAYDLAYIDANKREYSAYYEKVMELLRPGGLIIADDTMLGGKVYEEKVPSDRQTRGLVEFNELVRQDGRSEAVILPIRDGLTLIRKF